LEDRSLYLHGTGYTTKYFPGLYQVLKSQGNYDIKGISASSPLFAPFYDVKGAYMFGVNNGMIENNILVENEKFIDFLPLITKTKDEGAKKSIKDLLLVLYGTKKHYKPVNTLDLMGQCEAFHLACLKKEYSRTVFMNNPRFQMVSGITKTKLEVID